MALDESFWNAERDTLVAVILPVLLQSALDGATTAFNGLPAVAAVGVSWDTVSTSAQEWATKHTYDLVKGLTDTSRADLRDAIGEWIGSGEPLSELTDSLGEIFSPERARLIAATEVTRVFAQSNRAVWQASDAVTGMTFHSVEDDHVCPECEALDGETLTLDDDDNSPPIHPGCRCYLQPAMTLPD